MRRLLLAIVVMFSSSGCATLIYGTHRDVDLRSDPSGATVAFEGKTPLGTTPCVGKLESGQAGLLWFSKDGYKTDRRQVTYHPDALRSLWDGLAGVLVGVTMLVGQGSTITREKSNSVLAVALSVELVAFAIDYFDGAIMEPDASTYWPTLVPGKTEVEPTAEPKPAPISPSK